MVWADGRTMFNGKIVNNLWSSEVWKSWGDPVFRRQVLVFTLTYVAYCALYSTRKPFSVVKANIQTNLAISTYSLGAIDTAFLSCYAAGQLFIPSLCQKFAEVRVVLLVAFLGSCLCAFAFGSSHTASSMFGIWTLNGFFHSVVYPLFVRSLAPWFDPSARGRVLGTWTTSQQLGSLLATGFAAFAAKNFGWRSTFYIPAVVVGVVGGIVYLGLPSADVNGVGSSKENYSRHRSSSAVHIELHGRHDASCEKTGERKLAVPRRGGNRVEREFEKDEAGGDGAMGLPPKSRTRRSAATRMSDDSVSTEGRSPLEDLVPLDNGEGGDVVGLVGNNKEVNLARPPSFWEVLRITGMKNVAAAYFFVKCVRYSLLFWLPFYLRKGLGYDPATAGYSSMMFDLGGIPGAVFTGILSDKILKGRILGASIMSIAAAVSILVFSIAARWGFYPMLLSMGVVGFCLAGPDSVLGAAAAQDLCDRSTYGIRAVSVAAGLVNGMGSSGAVVQGLLTASISEVWGWEILFLTLCVCLVVAVLFLLPVVYRERGGTAAMKSDPVSDAATG